MTIERIKFFFISDVNCGVGQLGEENGRPRASQMKPARKSEAALCVLREFFRRLKTCFNSAKMLSSDGNGKGVRDGGERLSKFALVLDTQGHIKSPLYGLFTTTCGAGLLTSSCALTFWICADCSLTVAARRATVPSNSAILFC